MGILQLIVDLLVAFTGPAEPICDWDGAMHCDAYGCYVTN